MTQHGIKARRAEREKACGEAWIENAARTASGRCGKAHREEADRSRTASENLLTQRWPDEAYRRSPGGFRVPARVSGHDQCRCH